MALTIDGVLYLRIVDPYKASYGVEDPEFAITQLAQTTMRYISYYILGVILYTLQLQSFILLKLKHCLNNE